MHTDVCGPMRVTSCGGARYLVLFIDDFSRMMVVYFLKSKGEVYNAYESFVAISERQTSKKLKMLRSDNGRDTLKQQIFN